MIKGIFRAFLIASVASAALLFDAAPATARDIKAELAQKQAEHAETEQKSKELSGQVSDLKEKLISTSKNLRMSEQGVAEGNKKLKQLRSQKSDILDTLYKNNDTMNGFVTAAQQYRRTSTPQMLLLSTPLDAARASLIMKSMIPEINAQSDTLRGKLAELSRIEDDIATQLGRQAEQQKQLDHDHADLSKLLSDRQKLYQKNEEGRKAQEAEMARLAKEARNLEDLVAKVNGESNKRHHATAGGRLPANIMAPVTGTLKTGFGDTDDLGANSEGLTFETSRGATVITPLAGTVKFAGPFQKYKQILIVEHAGGYHSLIAGLGRIDTVVGATLAAGEPVGTAETTEDDPHIYYELRQGGAPVNPRQLLVAQRKQDKS